MRIALFQMNAGIDPQANASALVAGIKEAARGGAGILFTRKCPAVSTGTGSAPEA